MFESNQESWLNNKHVSRVQFVHVDLNAGFCEFPLTKSDSGAGPNHSVLFIVDVAQGKSLRLEVNPQFEFVNEDWPVGRALPDLRLCADYTGESPLELAVTNGDSSNYFQIRSLNDSCWTLILQKDLDADVIDQILSFSFSIWFWPLPGFS